jgi:hypothetical protein
MKKTSAVITLLLLVGFVRGQQTASPDFKATLKASFDALDSSTDYRQQLAQANRIALIALKWPDQWAAHYYLAYSKAIISAVEKDVSKRDAYLDEAIAEHDKAVSLLGKETDETYVLSALIINYRIAIDPMSRAMQMVNSYRANMNKAKELNASNPRIYFLEGMVKYGMPKFAGGGKDAALPFLQKADGFFATQTEGDILKPYWGKTKNSIYLQDCKSAMN